MPNNQKLKDNSEEELQIRIFRHWRIETGAVVNNRKGMSGVDGGSGTCHQWDDGFGRVSDNRSVRPEHKAATLSERSLVI